MKSFVNNIVEVAVNRNISAYKPGIGKKEFQSTATTFGQLKQELIEQGYDLHETRVFEGNTQIDLVSDAAILPTNINKRGRITNDLIIIMTPAEKPKSGSLDVNSYSEMKAFVKGLFSNDQTRAQAKEHFGNYTQLSKDMMRKLIATWGMGEEPAKKSKPAKPGLEQAFEKAKAALSSKKYKEEAIEEPVCVEFDYEVYTTALKHILHGVSLLQNLMVDFNKEDIDEHDLYVLSQTRD